MTGIVVFCLVFFSHMAQMIYYYMLKIVPKIQSSTMMEKIMTDCLPVI
jgi:hypothetical protein